MPLHLFLITLATEQGPEPEDVKAGWTAFLIFLLLIAAVVFLGFSLVKQLRKAQAAEDAGLYDHYEKKKSSETEFETEFETETADSVHDEDAGKAENAENGEPHPQS